jgi:rhomboid protease GluP
MANQFTQLMSERSDEQLLTIISQRDRYEPEAYLSAIGELERRRLATPEILHEKEKTYELIRQRDQQNVAVKNSSRDGFALLKPTRNYFYTPIILYINVAVWLLMVISGVDPMSPSVEHLLNWGGNLRGLTLAAEPWRLVTNIFLHGGAIHLAFNMYALITIGVILEPAFGRTRYLLCYVATGILASITSLAFHDNIVSVGASGAIFGLDGLLLALLITRNIDIPQEARKGLLSSTIVFIGYNLVFGFAKEGIDNAAHIGGLLSGFIFGLLYYSTLRTPERSKLISGVIIVVVIASVFLAPKFIRNQYHEYEVALETFSRNEEKALWMYGEEMPDSTNVPVFQKRLKEEGVKLWNENIAILNGLKEMPENLQQRIDLLKTYSKLRLQSCEAFSVMAEDNTKVNAEKVSALEEQINGVIKQLEDLNGGGE